MSRRLSLRRRSSVAEVKCISSKKFIPKKLINSYCGTACVCVSVADSSSVNSENDSKMCTKSWNLTRFIKPILFISVFIVIAVILVVFLHLKSDTVCYIRVGCFSLSGPFAQRPTAFNFVPQSPTVINTTFIVTSRKDPKGKHGTIRLSDAGNFGVVNEAHIPWNESSIIVFLIHGYTDRSGTWMQTLRDAFLAQKEDIIVVLVDWESGASGYYPQVVGNTRVVAREITLLVRYIQQRFGRDSPKRIHLVGHSLGAQISSYVGKSFVNSSYEIHQITALDPAFPLFEGYCPEIRLHKRDARHVLAIHSNIGPWGLGMKNPVGTVDIYLNDGRDQRGCPKLGGIVKGDDTEEEPIQIKMDNKSLPKILTTLNNVKDVLACSHRRAYSWLEDVLRCLAGTLFSFRSDSLETASLVAYPIKLMNGTDIVTLTKTRAVQLSLCQEHNENGCWKLERNENDAFFRLPIPEPNATSSSSSFLIPTTNESPFCVRFVKLELSICPILSRYAPLLGGWEPPISDENITVTLSQSIFDEEIQVYQGLLHSIPRIQTWVEFSCEELQVPVHHEDLPRNRNNGNNDTDNISESYLSVKLKVSLEVSDSVKKNDKPDMKSSRVNNPSICVSHMNLVYYNETKKDIIRLDWLPDKMDGAEAEMVITSNECREIMFPL